MEDTKDNKPSERQPPVEEKKPAVPAVPPPPPASPASTASPPAQIQAVPPRPPAPASVSPPTSGPSAKSTGRRGFLKALLAIGAVLSVVPFVPWENFLLSSVSSTGAYKRQKAVLDLNTPTNKNANGAVAGKTANVNDLASFPPNGSWLVTYPSSGDVTVDSQNPDTFQKFALIRLPQELGGSVKSAAAFVAFS